MVRDPFRRGASLPKLPQTRSRPLGSNRCRRQAAAGATGPGAPTGAGRALGRRVGQQQPADMKTDSRLRRLSKRFSIGVTALTGFLILTALLRAA